MELKNLLIGTIVIAMIILGSSAYLNGLQQSYGGNIDLSQFNQTRNRLETTQNTSSEMYEKLAGFSNWSNSPVAFLYASFDLIRAGWDGLKLVFNSLGLLVGITHDTYDAFGSSNFGFTMPDWLWGSLLAIIFIFMFMLLLEMFMRWKFQT